MGTACDAYVNLCLSYLLGEGSVCASSWIAVPQHSCFMTSLHNCLNLTRSVAGYAQQYVVSHYQSDYLHCKMTEKN